MRRSLWLLKAKKDVSFDCAHGFVVRALDEKSARKLASTQAGDEGDRTWLLKSLSTCVPLSTEGSDDVILRDFLHG